MVQQQQPDQLAQALIRQLQGSPKDLEARNTQSRLTFAAMISASRSNCNCEASRILRRALDAFYDDAMKDVPAESTPAHPELVEG